MSATARNQVFSAVHTIGGLIPADMLVRISEGRDVSGSKPADYRVVGARSVRDDTERHWDFLKSIWKELRTKLPVTPDAETPADPTGVAVSQWLLPLFNELGFGHLPVVGASGIASDDGGKTFAISHRWNHVPIHLIAWNAALDKRPAGAGGVPPQSLVQELLNRSEAHLWGVLTNGRQLRLLRDSSALATAAYVEFDLEAIFDGELFSEFVLLYRLLHVSRFEVGEGAAPSTCWLEKWRTEAIAAGTRALDQLRKGVQDAITALGTGFLRHPDNGALRENVDPQALHNALLRLVYRLLFLFVAEDRDALHHPDADEQARDRYAAYFSSARLRAHAHRRRGTTHSDLYQALRIVLDALGNESGRPELGLPGLGGLFDHDPVADKPLDGLSLSNEYLLTAVRHLSQVRDPGTRRWRSVDYRNLDAEELGSIYESLLELVPKHSAVDRTFELVELAGNTRKTTGSYYTPSSLIECLLDSALDPVIDDAVKRAEQAGTAAGQPDPSDAIVDELLSLTVCDPACGSGHFLVAAARRIAKRVAAVRERNPEPTVDAVRHALHEVVARCIYGVDINPMAVELAKVSLWMEALEPGKPLSFLDAHVKCGNALIGATPALLKQGIPDAAFKPIEGDDKMYAKGLEKQNAQQRANQGSLFDLDAEARVANTLFAQGLRRITAAPADNLGDVRSQASAYQSWKTSADYARALHVADAWCAAFMWRKTPDAPPAVTHGAFRALADPDAAAAPQATHDEIIRLRDQCQFFHWHLEFPEVFEVPEYGAGVDPATGWAGGFDCVLGNPPWERIRIKDQEFFAQWDEAIANAKTAAARKRLIAELKDDESRRPLYAAFEAAKRKAEGESHFLRNGGRYPLTGRGDINTYAIFSETDRMLAGPRGRMGVIVPTGIATDATTQFFFKDLVANGSITALYDFENAAPLFPGVHRSFKFSILSLAGRALREPAAKFAFFLHDPAELGDAGKSFALTPDEINLLNPNTGTCPVFRSRRDAEIALSLYSKFPILWDKRSRLGNTWELDHMQMFDMTHDSDKFVAAEDGSTFPAKSLYEGKMVHLYDHRWSGFSSSSWRELASYDKRLPSPVSGRFVVRIEDIKERLADRWQRDWLLGWRSITNATNERTLIPAVIPLVAVGNTLPLALPRASSGSPACFVAALSSWVVDFVARQSVAGTHVNTFILHQIPVPTPRQLAPHEHFIIPRVLELTYTAHDIRGFASDLGDNQAPFRWDEERRAVMRAELDALFFHLFEVLRDDVDYIMETFPIVKRKDEAKYGQYRTKELLLAEYDRMAAAGVSLTNPLVDGESYTSTLTPPPGHGPRHPVARAIPRQRAGDSDAEGASEVRSG
ncbi:Eco57I restriction-modification methylase domain-containing protein [Micromonospora sp. KC723]|uniref:Eco57I restriction-modification methylase domain-containing protein n=1 Tax=Micromonospora sp. KC723 TaxID=2530381 RepID=UPI00104D1377|nr:DNA methyltransferase [Micromonospora sp. KC723]TDB73394.1 SAM-dependent DNA methyltransferase [Micromonospora sp. KC723]